MKAALTRSCCVSTFQSSVDRRTATVSVMSSLFPATDCSTLTDQRLRTFVDRSQQFWSAAQPGRLDLPRAEAICFLVRYSTAVNVNQEFLTWLKQPELLRSPVSQFPRDVEPFDIGIHSAWHRAASSMDCCLTVSLLFANKLIG